MAGFFHTVTLPVGRLASRQLAWPPQTPDMLRPLVLDCTAWLADAGTEITPPPFVLADPSLTVGGISCDGKVIRLSVTGGVAGTQPVIAFALALGDGGLEHVNVCCPIVALTPAVPAGAVAIGSQPLTLEHKPIDVSEMQEPPGGVQIGDMLLLYRPGPEASVYLLPANTLGGAVTGGVTAASLAALLASLPTTLPDAPDQAWLNGGTLALS